MTAAGIEGGAVLASSAGETLTADEAANAEQTEPRKSAEAGFSALDPKDRKLLLICLCVVIVLAVMIAFFSRKQNSDDNPMPGSYLTGRHGARAAYEMLQTSGYDVQRWEQQLSDLAAQADAQTVVIFAEPIIMSPEDIKAVGEIVNKGGRVLLTGMTGGMLAPDGDSRPSLQFQAPCKLTPQGLDLLAGSGEVWMVPEAAWGVDRPRDRVQYNCAGTPAVVEYDEGKGHVVWWAGSTPLENGSIARADDLNLLLNALGPREGHHFYWDESLHGEVHSNWFYARGAALYLLVGGITTIALLVVFSFSRRRGPLRALPLPMRATPVEFLEALGSLYAESGASATAVELALERFRRKMGDLCGMKGSKMSAAELAGALRRRFPKADTELQKDLEDCEEAVKDDHLDPKRALQLVQMLGRHSEKLVEAARARKE
jgi:hypothetical protein